MGRRASANGQRLECAFYGLHALAALVQHERHVGFEYLPLGQRAGPPSSDRALEVHRVARPCLQRHVVMASPAAVDLPEPGVREDVAIEHEREPAPGGRIRERKPAVGEIRGPMTAEYGGRA